MVARLVTFERDLRCEPFARPGVRSIVRGRRPEWPPVAASRRTEKMAPDQANGNGRYVRCLSAKVGGIRAPPEDTRPAGERQARHARHWPRLPGDAVAVRAPEVSEVAAPRPQTKGNHALPAANVGAYGSSMVNWVAKLLAPGLILVVGIVVALGAYYATATRPSAANASPCGGCPPFFTEAFPGLSVYPPIYIKSWEEAHFDPLSGDPRGWSYIRPNRVGPGEITTVGPVPADMVGRWAVPLPLGFAVGGLAGSAIVAFARRRIRATRGQVRPHESRPFGSSGAE